MRRSFALGPQDRETEVGGRASGARVFSVDSQWLRGSWKRIPEQSWLPQLLQKMKGDMEIDLYIEDARFCGERVVADTIR